MTHIKHKKTLFEQVPALGAVSARGSGTAKLVPASWDRRSSAQAAFTLLAGKNRVGRDSDNDVVLDARAVSRFHCEVTVDRGEIWVRDLGGRNGTFVNRMRVGEDDHLIAAGDEIWFSPEQRFQLVMDEELRVPTSVDLDAEGVGHDERPPFDEPPAEALMTYDAGPPNDDLAAPAPPEQSSYEKLEKQRNALALLYQISLRCLGSADLGDIEELLTNVLKRLAPLDAGFILYRNSKKTFRATLVPGLDRPGKEAVTAITRYALRLEEPVVLSSVRELKPLGLKGRSAMLIPMVADDRSVGVVCCLSNEAHAYNDETLDIVMQLANVATAALVQRPLAL